MMRLTDTEPTTTPERKTEPMPTKEPSRIPAPTPVPQRREREDPDFVPTPGICPIRNDSRDNWYSELQAPKVSLAS
ncbi:MAG: hypothetical protein KDD62_02375 [Bdellovibrionales bacterium]|nr:hypothetical protein [Bdellovibrionales bacterium]